MNIQELHKYFLETSHLQIICMNRWHVCLSFQHLDRVQTGSASTEGRAECAQAARTTAPAVPCTRVDTATTTSGPYSSSRSSSSSYSSSSSSAYAARERHRRRKHPQPNPLPHLRRRPDLRRRTPSSCRLGSPSRLGSMTTR